MLACAHPVFGIGCMSALVHVCLCRRLSVCVFVRTCVGIFSAVPCHCHASVATSHPCGCCVLRRVLTTLVSLTVQLLRLEEELGADAKYAGATFRRPGPPFTPSA